MDAATSFLRMLQVMTAVKTAPIAETFQALIVGGLMAPRRTIMGMVRGIGTDCPSCRNCVTMTGNRRFREAAVRQKLPNAPTRHKTEFPTVPTVATLPIIESGDGWADCLREGPDSEQCR